MYDDDNDDDNDAFHDGGFVREMKLKGWLGREGWRGGKGGQIVNMKGWMGEDCGGDVREGRCCFFHVFFVRGGGTLHSFCRGAAGPLWPHMALR